MPYGNPLLLSVCYRLKLLSNGSGYGASLCASAALDAFVSVNFVLAIAFLDSSYGTCVCASAASDAIVCDLVCHVKAPP